MLSDFLGSRSEANHADLPVLLCLLHWWEFRRRGGIPQELRGSTGPCCGLQRGGIAGLPWQAQAFQAAEPTVLMCPAL